MLRTSFGLVNNLPITEEALPNTFKIKVILDSCLKLTESSPFEGKDFSSDFEGFFKYYIFLQNKRYQFDSNEPIGLYPYQTYIIKNLFDNGSNKSVYIKHPRQSGMTLLTVLYYVWKCIYTRGYNVVYVVQNLNNGQAVMEIIKSIGLDSSFVEINTKSEVRFSNGSRFKFHSSTNRSDIDRQFRGHSINVAIFDQFLWMDNYEVIMTTLYPCLKEHTGKFIFFNSGKSWTDFHNNYLGKSQSAFIFKDIKISELPNKDIEWAVKTIENIGLEAFKEEYL